MSNKTLQELIADVEKSLQKVKDYLKDKEVKPAPKKKEVFHSDVENK
jgi:hypothetical protein